MASYKFIRNVRWPLDHGNIKDHQIDRQKYRQVESPGFLWLLNLSKVTFFLKVIEIHWVGIQDFLLQFELFSSFTIFIIIIIIILDFLTFFCYKRTNGISILEMISVVF